MRFSILYRVDKYQGWYLHKKKKIIFREEHQSSSSKFSLIRRESDIWLKRSNRAKCYHLLPTEKVSKNESNWQANATITTTFMWGPASLKNRVVIYPCSKFKRRVWCSCQSCRSKFQKNVFQTKAIYGLLDDHQIYHKAWCTKYDFCNDVFCIIPGYRLKIYVNATSGLNSWKIYYEQAIF